MTPFAVADDDRAAYHAAAAIASNFLVALEAAAERLAATRGRRRARRSSRSCARASRTGPATAPGRALTGPIARGDEETVAAQRDAIAERAPELLPLFDVLGDRARALAEPRHAAAAGRRPDGAPTCARCSRRRAARAARSASSRPWARCTTGHRVADRARPRASTTSSSSRVFVNPTQFDDPADLAAYPRGGRRRGRRVRRRAPTSSSRPASPEVYPDGFATTVTVRGPLTETLEGAHRGRGHFDGVTTVVAKLLTMVAPGRRLLRPQGRPAGAVVTPHGARPRPADGDRRLPHRPRGRRPRALQPQRAALRRPSASARWRSRARCATSPRRSRPAASTSAGDASAAGLAALRSGGADPEYFEAVDPQSLAPAGELRGDVLLLTAARVGDVRLIDNLAARAPAAGTPTTTSDHETRAATALAASTPMS